MNTTDTTLDQSRRITGYEGMLYLEECGSGGTPLIFAHSFGGNAGQWRHQLQHFQTERKVIAFDFRSHGRSDPGHHFGAAALSRDIEAVVDQMKLQKFVLVGHSMGGAASIAYVQAHP